MTLPRWVDGDERAGALLRAARAVRVPAPPSLEAVRVPRTKWKRPPTLVIALVTIGPLLAFAAASGVRALFATAPTPTMPPVQTSPRADVETVFTPPPPEELPQPVTEVPAVRPQVRKPVAAPVAPVEAPAPVVAPRSTLGDEARAIATALEASRAGQFQQTVSLLETYRGQFPAGVLLPEAVIAEARAERSLHHRAQALAALDRLDDEASAKHPELLVLRGELLAEQGECQRAVEPLERAIATLPTGVLAEQAQFTRANCAVTLEEPGARSRVEAFLAAWPSGQFNAQAQALLDMTR